MSEELICGGVDQLTDERRHNASTSDRNGKQSGSFTGPAVGALGAVDAFRPTQQYVTYKNGIIPSGLPRLEGNPDCLLIHAVHELRNPLSTIRANAQLAGLMLSSGKGEVALSYVNRIQRDVDGLNDLLEGMLNSDADSNARSEKIADLRHILDRISGWFVDCRGSDHGMLVINSLDESILVPIDPRSLERACTQLVKHAFAVSADTAIISLDVEKCGDSVRIRISDDSPGCVEAGPRYRVEQGYSPELGECQFELMAAHRIIKETPGGEILYSLDQSEGATFVISLPMVCTESQQ